MTNPTPQPTRKENREIVIPILNDEYKVIVCWGDYKSTNKIIKSWHHDEIDESEWTNRRGFCCHKKDCHPIIVLPKYPKTPEEIGTLAHEAFHAVSNIWNKIEDESHDEVFAHSIGAIVRNVLQIK